LISKAVDLYDERKKPLGVTILAVLVFYIGIANFSFHRTTDFMPWIEEYNQEKRDLTVLDEVDDDMKMFVIDNKRAVDFNLASLIPALGYDINFAKGLFWESQRSNQMLSSYLATLLSPDNIVTHYFYYFGMPCDVYQ
jgi:hypothetical protein